MAGGSDDFGSFSFKNLPVLKQANDDVIRKLRTDQMTPITHALTEPASFHQRKRSVSRFKKPSTVVTNMDHTGNILSGGPPSPATSTSSIASSPSRTSIIPSTPAIGNTHSRKPSEYGAVERFKFNYMEGLDRRNSMAVGYERPLYQAQGMALALRHGNRSVMAVNRSLTHLRRLFILLT